MSGHDELRPQGGDHGAVVGAQRQGRDAQRDAGGIRPLIGHLAEPRVRDDAAGEAFDKVARLLGLPYPGGPEIDRAAIGGDPAAIRFPRGLTQPKDLAAHRYDFSFSGLKTAVARWVEQREAAGEPVPLADVAASFREAVVDVLVSKAIAACTDLGVPRLLLGGGVVANARLREVADERADAAGIALRIPPLSLCTDNGAMIAALGSQRIMAGHGPSSLGFGADSTLPVTDIQA